MLSKRSSGSTDEYDHFHQWILLILVCGFVLSLSTTGQADDFILDDGGNDSDWTNNANWEPDSAPITGNLGASNDNVLLGESIADGAVDSDSAPGDVDGETVLLSSSQSGMETLTLGNDATGDYEVQGPGALTFSSDGALIQNLDDSQDLILDSIVVNTTSGGPLTLDTTSSTSGDIVFENGAPSLNTSLSATAGNATSIILGSGFTEASGTNNFEVSGQGVVEVNDSASHSGVTRIGLGSDASTLSLSDSGSLTTTSSILIDGGGSGAELEINADNNSINDAATIDIDDAGDTLDVNGDEVIGQIDTDADSSVDVESGSELTVSSAGNSNIDGSLTVNSNAVLEFDGGGSNSLQGTGSDGFTLDGTARFNGTGDTTISGDLTGGGTMDVQGDHTVSLVDTNNGFTGDVQVGGANGLLQLSAGNALGAITALNGESSGTIEVSVSNAINDAANLDLDGSSTLDLNASDTINALNTESGTSVQVDGPTTLSINDGGGTSLIGGDVSGAGDLTILGGTTTIAGSTSFTGTARVQGAGVLDATASGALGGVSNLETAAGTAEEIRINASNAINNTADLALNNSGDSLTVNESDTIDALDTTSGSTVTLNDTLTVGADDGTFTISGDVTGSGHLTVTGDGGGPGSTVTIDSDGTTFSGTTTVEDQSTLNLETADALENTDQLSITGGSEVLVDGAVSETINDSATVDLNGTDDVLDVDGTETVDAITTGSDSDVQIASSTTLTINNSGGSSSVGGDVSGAGILEIRTGDATISSATTLSGSARVDNKGVLLLDNADALGGISSISTLETASSGTQAEIQINNVGSSVIADSASVSLDTDRDLLDVNQDETIGTLTTTSNTAVDINSTLAINSGGGTSTLDGTITGPGTANLTVLGGTADVNSSTTFGGTAEVQADATLNLNTGGALFGVSQVQTTTGASTATVTVNAQNAINDSANVGLNSDNDVLALNQNETIDALNTSTTTDVQLGSNTLGIGFAGSSSSISGDVSGTGILSVIGGTATIDTDGTSFTGAANVQESATLNLSTAGALGGADINAVAQQGSSNAEITITAVDAINDTGDVSLNGSNGVFDVDENDAIDQLTTASGSTVQIESGDTLTIGSDGNNSLIDGGLAESGTLELDGGTATITSDNSGSFTGDTNLTSSATLAVGNDNALGTGTLVIDGGDIQAFGQGRNVPNDVTVNAGFEFSGSNALEHSGPVTAGGLGGSTVEVNVSNTAETLISGQLTASNGTLEKDGSGVLAISDDNSGSLSADWLIDGGRLDVRGDSIGTGNVELGGGNIALDVPGQPTVGNNIMSSGSISTVYTLQDVEVGGTISGSSALEKDGGALLILSADNSGFSGGLTVNNGDLEVQDEEALGTGALTMSSAGSQLVLNDTTSGTEDYDNNVDASSDFTLSVQEDSELSNEIYSGGTITRTGTGDLELSGDSSAGATNGGFTGTLNLDQATTDVSGSFGTSTSVVNVSNGAMLEGTGTIGGNVQLSGTLSPGNSPGVITIEDGATLDSGSTTIIERDASVGNFLNAAGTGHDQVDMDGSTLDVASDATIDVRDLQPSSGSTQVFYPDGASFDAFENTSVTLLGGQQPNIIDDDNLVGWDLQSDGDLQADRTEYDQVPNVSLSNNQSAVADGYDALAASTPAGAPATTPGISSDEESDQSFLLNLDTMGQALIDGGATSAERSAYKQALNAASPQRYSSLFSSQRRVMNAVQDVKARYLANQLRTIDLGLTSMQQKQPQELATAGENSLPAAHAYPGEPNGWSGFAKALGVFAEEDETSNRVGYDADATGMLVGVDNELSDQVKLGVSLTYARTDVSMGGMGGEADVDTIRVGPYISYQPTDEWYISGTASYGVHQQDTERNTMTGTAEAEVDADDISASLNTGYDVAEAKDLVVEPMAGLRTTFYSQDGFTESGAGSSNLSVGSQDSESVESRIGARVAKTFEYHSGETLIPSLTLAWRNEFSEDNENTEARFTGAGSGFEIERGDAPDTAVEIGAGLKAELTQDLSLFGNYTGTFYDDATNHSIGAGLRISF